MPFVVLADDSTGANASAGALAQSLGVMIPVMDRIPPQVDTPFVLNSRSREDASRSRLVAQWARALWDRGVRDLDKRVDTTLRGPGPAELEELVSAIPDSPWIGVVAAYPGAGRTTRGGRQFLDGVPLAERMDCPTDVLADYLFGPESRCLVVETNKLSSEVLPESLADTSVPVIFDATDNADLAQIARVLRIVRRRHEGTMITVSSGALLNYYPATPAGPTAILIGSPTAINMAQLRYLAERLSAFVWPLEQTIGEHTPGPEGVVILHSGLNVVEPAQRQNVSGQLARWAVTRLDELAQRGWAARRIIASGGEMSQSFLDQSGASGTLMAALGSPLVGHGTIVGGHYEGIEFLTKGGLVGYPALLVELALGPALHQ